MNSRRFNISNIIEYLIFLIVPNHERKRYYLRGLLFFYALYPCYIHASPCNEPAIINSVTATLRDYLQNEANGSRLDELLGRRRTDDFSKNVLSSESDEPGWDTIEIRNDFIVGKLSCDLDGNFQEWSAIVSFPAGWWFSRENFGREKASDVSYRLRKQGERFLLVPPLPQPFLSPTGARRFIGSPPFQKPTLVEILNQL